MEHIPTPEPTHRWTAGRILLTKRGHAPSSRQERTYRGNSPAHSSADVDQHDGYLSVKELAHRIGYRPQTIRNLMCQGVFELNIHYFKPFGRPLFKWSAVVALIERQHCGNAQRV